ncbi:Nn.00g025050.m01.CDS01 [Neocucurbitaria sp. VM-36]
MHFQDDYRLQHHHLNLTKYSWKLLDRSDGGGYQIDIGDIRKKTVINPGDATPWHVEWWESGEKRDAQFNIYWGFDRPDKDVQVHIQLVDASARHVNVQPLGFSVPGIDLGQSKDIGFTHNGTRTFAIWDATGNENYRLINW